MRDTYNSLTLETNPELLPTSTNFSESSANVLQRLDNIYDSLDGLLTLLTSKVLTNQSLDYWKDQLKLNILSIDDILQMKNLSFVAKERLSKVNQIANSIAYICVERMSLKTKLDAHNFNDVMFSEGECKISDCFPTLFSIYPDSENQIDEHYIYTLDHINLNEHSFTFHRALSNSNNVGEGLSSETEKTSAEAKGYEEAQSTTFLNGLESSDNNPRLDQSPNICKNEKCQTGTRKRLSKATVDILNIWFTENKESPYLTKGDLTEIVSRTGLHESQVKNWVSNKRRKEKSSHVSQEVFCLL